MTGLISRFRVVMCLAALPLLGCATASEREVPGEFATLPFTPASPHWDQVCEPGPHPGFFRPAEILSDEADLRSAADEHLPPSAALPEVFVDVAVHYHADGRVRAVYLFESSIDDAAARELAAAVRARVRAQPRLLHPTALRLRVERGESGAALRLLPPLHCRPHIAHEEGEIPRFAGQARIQGGRFLVASRRHRSIAVRVHVSALGELEHVEPLAGNEALLERAAGALSALDLDPALENGEPVEGHLNLVLEFEDQDAGLSMERAGASDAP